MKKQHWSYHVSQPPGQSQFLPWLVGCTNWILLHFIHTSSKPSSFWSETVLKFFLNVLYLALTKGHNSEKEEAITIRLFIVHAQLHIKMNHSDKYAELLFNYYYLFFYLIIIIFLFFSIMEEEFLHMLVLMDGQKACAITWYHPMYF